MREKLLNWIREGKDVCQEAEIEEQILDRYKNLETKLEDYKLPVPVVGDFSAGKSTLLNSFLGRDVLSTDITPETAIAAEIKYGTEEKIRCHYRDQVQKESREVALNNINNLEASKLKHIEIYLNIAKLKEYPDLYLVDMPGRDSSYENHNKAILQYLEEDVYYIVVTDVEHGGLKGSILKFIQDDLRGNDLNFSVLINKADKKPPSAVESIIAQTKKRASALAQEDVFVGRTSAVDNEIEDLENILDQINVEDVVVNKFKGDLLELVKDSIEYFDVLLQGQFNDTSEIDTKIMELNNKIREVNQQLKQEEAEISRKFGIEIIDKVVNDVKSTLQGNIGMLANAARSSNLENTVSDLVRPVITRSIKNNAGQVLQQSLDNIEGQLSSSLSDLGISSVNVNDMNDISTEEEVDVEGVVSKAMAGAALGSIIPIGGTILGAVVGGVIGAVVSLFGGSSKQRHRGPSVREQIKSNVIPQVTNQVRPNVRDALEEVKNNFIEKVEQRLDEKKSDLTAALEELKQEKEKSKEEFEAWINQIKAAINDLEEVKTKLAEV